MATGWTVGKTYKLVVPPDVPARDFWSVVAYDRETAAWIRDMPKVGIDSSKEGVVTNEDGSVDVYFGPKAPEGKEANWIPTAEGQRFYPSLQVLRSRTGCLRREAGSSMILNSSNKAANKALDRTG